ncbi:CUB domain-containing protein, partial [Trichonephila clavata]
SMKDIGSCSNGNSIEIELSSMSSNSSGILISDWDTRFEPNLHCVVILKPPLTYGLVASVRNIDLQPYAANDTNCRNYLELSQPFKVLAAIGILPNSGFESGCYSSAERVMHWKLIQAPSPFGSIIKKKF